MNADYKCLKNSSSICYIFFTTDDVTVTSVNTYTSLMGISIEDKYLVKSLRENKKYGAKRLFKLFPNKNWSPDGLKALIEKNDNLNSYHQYSFSYKCWNVCANWLI